MRSLILGLTIMAAAAHGAIAAEDQVYRWTDHSGHLHFSNVPAPGAEATGIVSDEELPVTPAGTPDQPDDGTAPSPARAQPEAAAEESPHVAVERQDLEHQIRDAERQLQALDTRLDDLARIRTRFSKGSPVGGGFATNAANVQSDEEKGLAKERDALQAGVNQMRADHAKLH